MVDVQPDGPVRPCCYREFGSKSASDEVCTCSKDALIRHKAKVVEHSIAAFVSTLEKSSETEVIEGSQIAEDQCALAVVSRWSSTILELVSLPASALSGIAWKAEAFCASMEMLGADEKLSLALGRSIAEDVRRLIPLAHMCHARG